MNIGNGSDRRWGREEEMVGKNRRWGEESMV
jgi:hypothetical protein